MFVNELSGLGFESNCSCNKRDCHVFRSTFVMNVMNVMTVASRIQKFTYLFVNLLNESMNLE